MAINRWIEPARGFNALLGNFVTHRSVLLLYLSPDGADAAVRTSRLLHGNPSVCLSAALTAAISAQVPNARSISESSTVARLSVITTESSCKPVCRPCAVCSEIETRLGCPARAGLLVIIATIV